MVQLLQWSIVDSVEWLLAPDLLVCLRVNPPVPALVTVLPGQPRGVEAEVGQVWTLFVLILSGLAGVETRPGVEDKRTVGRAAVKTGQVEPACALNQTEQEDFRGNKVGGGRIHDLIKHLL